MAIMFLLNRMDTAAVQRVWLLGLPAVAAAWNAAGVRSALHELQGFFVHSLRNLYQLQYHGERAESPESRYGREPRRPVGSLS
jgi:hypothetical protein